MGIEKATHQNKITGKKYHCDNGVWKFWSEFKKEWVTSYCVDEYLLEHLVPIDNINQKEYLQKLEGGSYKLIVLSDVVDGHDGLIEVPEGAELYFRFSDQKTFVKFSRDDNAILWTNGEWVESEHYDKTDLFDEFPDRILWQRPTNPEELPFIDDEPRQHISHDYSKSSVDKTLDERQSQYGSFSDVANTTQYLLQMLSNDEMSDVQLESLHMICSKLARIRHGDVNHVDSWHDIAGYATLVVKDLESK